MTEHVIRVIEKPDGTERVYIVRRTDGYYSYRKQWQSDDSDQGAGTWAWPDGHAGEVGWTPIGLCAGLYDSAETAMWEALCRVDWLALVVEPN